MLAVTTIDLRPARVFPQGTTRAVGMMRMPSCLIWRTRLRPVSGCFGRKRQTRLDRAYAAARYKFTPQNHGRGNGAISCGIAGQVAFLRPLNSTYLPRWCE